MLLLQGCSVGRSIGLVLVHPIPGGFSGWQAFFAAYLCMQFVFENEACCQVKAGEMGVQLGWGGSGGREERREGGREEDRLGTALSRSQPTSRASCTLHTMHTTVL